MHGPYDDWSSDNKWGSHYPKSEQLPSKPTDIIEDDPAYRPPCCHPQHEPPRHICIPPGKRLRHRCPGCGKETVIVGHHVFM